MYCYPFASAAFEEILKCSIHVNFGLEYQIFNLNFAHMSGQCNHHLHGKDYRRVEFEIQPRLLRSLQDKYLGGGEA